MKIDQSLLQHKLTTNIHPVFTDRQYIDLTIYRLSDFLVELAQSPADKNFPFAE